MNKPITVFHKSADGRFLVEVKQYHHLYAAKWWAKQHPDAHVYLRVDVGPDKPKVWMGFEPLFGRKNGLAIKLASKDIERLPELLDSGSGGEK